ncbi:sensory rhodopsin transducer [Natrialba sp. SSL1]|uniref:sensory rhodopsin transducer n=1 Tax=Natrialba sp. SSL1 TaxID=1869245 RepID=UPI000A0788FB|nr:sensory rhodopsin transducer [Natrialba sp. SSL1]
MTGSDPDADSAAEQAAEAGSEPAAPIGETRWEIPGGHVPVESTGPEPEMVSNEKLCLLNTGPEMATLELTLYYANGHEAGPYPLTVAPERVRHVRVNDLIDPYAPPLAEDYGIVVESNVPIVVQWSRQDTRQAANAGLSTMAYGEDDASTEFGE